MLKRTKRYILSPKGGLLHGRAQGKELREQIASLLEDTPPDTLLPLDFHKVKFIDFSCADELIAKLVKRVATGDLSGRYLILLRLSDSAKENIQAALELRQLVCVYETAEQDYELLGKVSPEIIETYNLALEKGKLTARDLVEHAGKSITASSNRLARLRNLGLLAWTGNEAVGAGGRQNVYEPVG